MTMNYSSSGKIWLTPLAGNVKSFRWLGDNSTFAGIPAHKKCLCPCQSLSLLEYCRISWVPRRRRQGEFWHWIYRYVRRTRYNNISEKPYQKRERNMFDLLRGAVHGATFQTKPIRNVECKVCKKKENMVRSVYSHQDTKHLKHEQISPALF